jgi:ParG
MSRFAQLSKPEPKDARAILAFAEKEVMPVVAPTAVVKKTKGQVAPAGMKRLTINLPEELHMKLRMKSVQAGTTATDIIVQLLRSSI